MSDMHFLHVNGKTPKTAIFRQNLRKIRGSRCWKLLPRTTGSRSGFDNACLPAHSAHQIAVTRSALIIQLRDRDVVLQQRRERAITGHRQGWALRQQIAGYHRLGLRYYHRHRHWPRSTT